MTKLMEWLAALGVLIAIWLGLVTNTINNSFIENNPTLVTLSPIICVALFGAYAAFVVLYRVFTFNNCEEAAAELQKEILEARKDLSQKGFVFKTGIV